MSKKESPKKKNKEMLILIIIFIVTIIIASGLFIYKNIYNKPEEEKTVSENTPVEVKEEPKKPEIKIFSGTDRPIAVMIDNHKGAWPQAGINKAYCIYEIIVEGGESRLMAVFKGADLKEIGPVRSSRHYFLDYALENDAIYVHHGWSPQAQSDISSLKINNINGISESSSNFWRIKAKSAPHNVFIKTADMLQLAEKKKYSTTSTSPSVLNYVSEEVKLENGTEANEVAIQYSTLHNVTYKYDETNKVYTRYARGTLQTDYTTKENITTKNIIITFAENYTLNDPENKGRQGLKNIGTLDGYYITNGKAIKIKCKKTSRAEKTVYTDLEGNVIDVNDGNTFINIVPIDAKVKFE